MAKGKLSPITRLLIVIFIITPVVAWILVKPVRVVAPRMIGISCVSSSVCLDDPSKSQEASQLYQEALGFVSGSVAPIQKPPKVVFCSSKECADSFGLGARSAVTLGTFGTVIGPKAWKPYYVRHEMIHYLQGEHIGVIATLFKPTWFIEGMAYSLSEDPRQPLAEPFEDYRSRFNEWSKRTGKDHFWDEAGKL